MFIEASPKAAKTNKITNMGNSFLTVGCLTMSLMVPMGSVIN